MIKLECIGRHEEADIRTAVSDSIHRQMTIAALPGRLLQRLLFRLQLMLMKLGIQRFEADAENLAASFLFHPPTQGLQRYAPFPFPSASPLVQRQNRQATPTVVPSRSSETATDLPRFHQRDTGARREQGRSPVPEHFQAIDTTPTPAMRRMKLSGSFPALAFFLRK